MQSLENTGTQYFGIEEGCHINPAELPVAQSD